MVTGLSHHSMMLIPRSHQSDQCRKLREPTLLMAKGPLISRLRVHCARFCYVIMVAIGWLEFVLDVGCFFSVRLLD
jgi:hypothetical protein